MWICVFLTLFCHSLVNGLNLTEFHIDEYCGTTLQENVGMLYFNSDDLRTSDQQYSQCSVTVKLIPSRRYSKIMFYFQTFDLIWSCEDTNLTITQEYYGQPATRILGLADHMCGKNDTILQTGLNFTTFSDEITITYSYSDKGKQLPGYFSIKFVEFHTGDCDSEHEHKCMYTDRCVSKEYHCSSGVQTCPPEDTSCDNVKYDDLAAYAALWQLGVTLAMLLLVYFIIRYLIPKCVNKLCKCTKRNSRRRYETQGRRRSAERQSVRRVRGIASTRHTEAELDEHRTTEPDLPASRTTELTRFEPRSPYLTPLTSNHSELSFTLELAEDDIPTSNVAHFTHADNNQLVPPPSYEEVVAPSYEDVLADTAKYQTSLL